jgi:hypothetical protein
MESKKKINIEFPDFIFNKKSISPISKEEKRKLLYAYIAD